MDNVLMVFWMLIPSYFLGSINFSVLISVVFRTPDPRTYGSKNPGATNMLRSKHPLSKILALATLLLDAFKGYAAVWLAFNYAGEHLASLAFIGVVLGHLYPVFFKFKGGKGIAVGWGGLLMIHSLMGVLSLLLWVVVFFFGSKRSSLAAVVTLLGVLILMFYFPILNQMRVAIFINIALIVWRHKDNIHRLIQKKEDAVL